MPDYPNNSFSEHLWNKTKEFFGFKQEPITLREAYTNDSATIPRAQQEEAGDKNSDVAHLSRREQRLAYERQIERFAHNPSGKYDSAVPHTGATREATTGRTFNRVNSEERMARGYEVERALLHKNIREKGLSKSYSKAIAPLTQGM